MPGGDGVRRLALDTVASYARFGVTIVSQLVLVPIIIGSVGDEAYGLWTLTFSVLGLLSLVDFGFTTGVVRYVAECRGGGDTGRRNRILSTVLVVYLSLTVVAAASVLATDLSWDAAFSIPEALHDQARLLLWVLAARWILVGLPFGIYRSILFGDRHIAAVNLIQAASALAYALTSWGVLAAGLGLIALAWVNLVVFGLEHVAYVVVAYRRVPELHLSPRLAERALFRETASFSAYQFIVAIAALVLLKLPPVLVKLFLSLEAVAVYGVALKVAENALLLFKQGINVLAPWVAELHGRGDAARVRTILVAGARLSLAPAAALSAAVASFAPELLAFWVGPGYAAGAWPLVILMASTALAAPQMVASTVFTMTGHQRWTAGAAVAGMVINLGVSLALVRPLGLPGVALGTLIATVLVDGALVAGIAHRHFGVGLWQYTRDVFLRGLWPAAVQVALSLSLKVLLPPSNLIQVAFEALPGLVAYGALFWMGSMDTAERRLVLDRLGRRRHDGGGSQLPPFNSQAGRL